MKIKRFGETLDGITYQWYETDKGERSECDDDMIHDLWNSWMSGLSGGTSFDGTYTIFEFKEPFNYKD